MIDPLPCPLCGQPAWVQTFTLTTTVQCPSKADYKEGHSVYVFHPDKDKAIELWNQRAS